MLKYVLSSIPLTVEQHLLQFPCTETYFIYLCYVSLFMSHNLTSIFHIFVNIPLHIILFTSSSVTLVAPYLFYSISSIIISNMDMKNKIMFNTSHYGTHLLRLSPRKVLRSRCNYHLFQFSVTFQIFTHPS